ncbi:MAG: methyltransferase domain-containing protein [Anaerolineae bacterium]|nr:methyltransferase domain-containing protein [Anaerolineae bacterium]
MPSTTGMPEAATAQTLIDSIRRAGLLDTALEAAFRALPRAAFLPNLPLDQVYKDEAVPIKVDEDGTVLSSSSQPSMMAIMLQQLDLKPGQNVLEIGTGTGYNAALMQYLVGDEGKVTTIEIDAQVAEQARANLQRAAMSQVQVVESDGAVGYAPRASYDRIMATAGVWDVPRAWVRQMKPKGVLVAPIWMDGFEVSAALTLQPDGTLYSRDNRLCWFIRLRGQASGPETAVRVATSGLYVYSSAHIDSAALQMLLSDDAEETYLGVQLDSWEYWRGFLPYFVLNVPDSFVLARYHVDRDTSPYGITSGGFALITPGSACFVPVGAKGAARSFGSADALLAVQETSAHWERDGKPRQDRLRLRLIPSGQPFDGGRAKVYTRRDHDLIAWLEREGTDA